jgi:hypothetical protein
MPSASIRKEKNNVRKIRMAIGQENLVPGWFSGGGKVPVWKGALSGRTAGIPSQYPLQGELLSIHNFRRDAAFAAAIDHRAAGQVTQADYNP